MTPEQKQLLEQIRERVIRWRQEAFHYGIDKAIDDIDFLLSVVEEQEAAIALASKQLDDALVRAAEDQDYDSEQRTKIAESMRSACVEKVAEIHDEYEALECAAEVIVLSRVARELESLTLQEQEAKQL